ncbi:hypothetical protein GCM10010222_80310 [Streptomyces tanashiensis]|nr:hypothetical protein GCM10010222_80310 [Streptomyces tanashiensis]
MWVVRGWVVGSGGVGSSWEMMAAITAATPATTAAMSVCHRWEPDSHRRRLGGPFGGE